MSVVESDAEGVQRLVGTACGASGPQARVAGALTAGLLAGCALAVVARRLSVRTGVSDEEAFGSLPGDEVIPHPMVEWTRGVTVHTTPERVWPWLVQMGYGRGGWYTPEWVDLFANRWVFGARGRFPRSAGRLLPEYQHIAVGDLICDGPDYASYFRVQRVDPCKALVYRSIPPSPAREPDRHHGSPIAPAGRAAASRFRHVRRFHLDLGAESSLESAESADTVARANSGHILAASPRATDCAAGFVRRDVRHRNAACDRQARRGSLVG
jgi:hypothetical protein